jgi:hypothetical protein
MVGRIDLRVRQIQLRLAHSRLELGDPGSGLVCLSAAIGHQFSGAARVLADGAFASSSLDSAWRRPSRAPRLAWRAASRLAAAVRFRGYRVVSLLPGHAAVLKQPVVPLHVGSRARRLRRRHDPSVCLLELTLRPLHLTFHPPDSGMGLVVPAPEVVPTTLALPGPGHSALAHRRSMPGRKPSLSEAIPWGSVRALLSRASHTRMAPGPPARVRGRGHHHEVSSDGVRPHRAVQERKSECEIRTSSSFSIRPAGLLCACCWRH